MKRRSANSSRCSASSNRKAYGGSQKTHTAKPQSTKNQPPKNAVSGNMKATSEGGTLCSALARFPYFPSRLLSPTCAFLRRKGLCCKNTSKEIHIFVHTG